MDFRRHGFASLILIAWISQAIYLFYPFPTELIDTTAQAYQELANKNRETLTWMKEQGSTNIDVETVADDLTSELWRSWFVRLGFVMAGLVSGVMAWYAVRFWRLAVIATALLYLANWYIDTGVLASVSLPRSYEIKWMFAKTSHTVAAFVHRDVVLPLFYLAVVASLVLQSVRSQPKSRSN